MRFAFEIRNPSTGVCVWVCDSPKSTPCHGTNPKNQNRYLQEDGAEIQSGQPYVEVEAMKMIMPLKAQARAAFPIHV